MRGVERLGDVAGDAQCFIEGSLAARETRGERLAFEILHHQEVESVLLADVVELADVRIPEGGNGLGLDPKALAQVLPTAQPIRDRLDGHRAPQAGIGRALDLAHPVRADRRSFVRGRVACQETASRQTSEWPDYIAA